MQMAYAARSYQECEWLIEWYEDRFGDMYQYTICSEMITIREPFELHEGTGDKSPKKLEPTVRGFFFSFHSGFGPSVLTARITFYVTSRGRGRTPP